MGTPIVLQGLWRTADRVSTALLEQVHTALRGGPLGRRVVRPRVPGARATWRANDSAHPLRITEHPLPVPELLDWADAQGSDLDPEFGPGWRLSAARLTDGGSVVSLTCSHALADGRGLTIAVDQALRGLATQRTAAADHMSPGATTPRRTAAEHAIPGITTRRTASAAHALPEVASRRTAAAGHPLPGKAVRRAVAAQSDWADARRQWAIVLGGTARALRRGVPDAPAAPADRAIPPGSRVTCGAVLQVPAADWDLVSAGHGGTANSLFVFVVAKMLWDSGFPGDEIGVSVPVDTRAEARVDNDMAMTEITATRADTPATLREKCRAAYEHRMSAPGGMPEELLQVLPDRLAYRLSRGAGERDILCSNIGTLPAALSHLGPHPCTGVAARAIHPGLLPTRLPRTRLSAYLSRTDRTYTLALIALDPEHIETPEALRNLAASALDSVDLPSTSW
ncbi:hypothetical protein IU476_14590 [Nocardia blacklockiae]|nr:hypothetical protein [Nocardia blacklockiae]